MVHALDGDLGRAEEGVERGDEGGADNVADVALLGGAAGEEEGEVFAGGGGEVVAGGAGEDNVGAVGWEGGGGDAGEAARRWVSGCVS